MVGSITIIVRMKSLTKKELAEGLADLASRAIASDDHESPWLQFHEDCVAELEKRLT